MRLAKLSFLLSGLAISLTACAQPTPVAPPAGPLCIHTKTPHRKACADDFLSASKEMARHSCHTGKTGCDDTAGKKEAEGNRSTDMVMCTQDVQQCPDGRFVGRTPPSCAFICDKASGSAAVKKGHHDH